MANYLATVLNVRIEAILQLLITFELHFIHVGNTVQERIAGQVETV